MSANFFEVLGLSPAQGRYFRPEEGTRPGAEPVAVISHDLWQRQFHGASNILGQAIELNGRTLTIIGVTPAGFRGGMNSLGFDVWVPLTMAAEMQPATVELTSRSAASLLDADATQTRRNPRAGASRLERRGQTLPCHLSQKRIAGLGYELLPLWQVPRGGRSVVLALATLQAFAVLILIVVCANTANLLLARASVREREIGVRLALGAGPGGSSANS